MFLSSYHTRHLQTTSNSWTSTSQGTWTRGPICSRAEWTRCARQCQSLGMRGSWAEEAELRMLRSHVFAKDFESKSAPTSRETSDRDPMMPSKFNEFQLSPLSLAAGVLRGLEEHWPLQKQSTVQRCQNSKRTLTTVYIHPKTTNQQPQKRQNFQVPAEVSDFIKAFSQKAINVDHLEKLLKVRLLTSSRLLDGSDHQLHSKTESRLLDYIAECTNNHPPYATTIRCNGCTLLSQFLFCMALSPEWLHNIIMHAAYRI